MLKALLLHLMTLALSGMMMAQNLVPNPSFEIITQCPDDYGQASYAEGWFQCMASADLYNVCSDTAGVPGNLFGYQMPASGDGYVGMTTFTNCDCPSGTHEIIGIKLPQQLQVGTTYWASVKVSRTAGYVEYQTRSRYATNGLGILCKMDSLSGFWLWDPLPNRAHVFSEAIITDTLSWVVVSGSFVCDSSYQWLYVGNFLSDDSTAALLVNPESDDEFSHYYVDDVCLSLNSGDCPLALTVNDPPAGTFPRAFYLLDASAIRVEGLSIGDLYEAEVYDVAGRSITNNKWVSADGSLSIQMPIDLLKNGIVILRVWSGRGEWRFKLPISLQ